MRSWLMALILPPSKANANTHFLAFFFFAGQTVYFGVKAISTHTHLKRYDHVNQHR